MVNQFHFSSADFLPKVDPSASFTSSLDATLTTELLEPDEAEGLLKEGRFLAYSTADLILKDSNKELNSLPECLVNLNRLCVINLVGSNPKLIIPEKLKQKMESDETFFFNN